MPEKETDVTGVILVGGESRRMGVDKAFLEVGGTPLFERVLRVFREAFDTTILVGNHAGRFAGYGHPLFSDMYPGSSLGGLYTGLMRAETPYIFVSACDVPFPSISVARYLVSRRDGYDAVVPKGADGLEPLFAVYSKGCGERMRRLLEKRNFCISDLYPDINVRYVLPEDLARQEGAELTFLNLNTPEEYVLATRKGTG